MLLRALLFALVFVTCVQSRLVGNGLYNDISFEPPFDGSLFIDGWFIAGGGSTMGINASELQHTASTTLGVTTRMGLVQFFDLDGGDRITYEFIADRCNFAFLGPVDNTFQWNYSWGKSTMTGGPIAAKFITYNPLSNFGANFVYLPPNQGPDVFHDENINSATPRWVIANVFWFGTLGMPSNPPGPLTFINDVSQIATLENAFNTELFPNVGFAGMVTVNNFADTGGTPRSLDAWLDPTTTVADYVNEMNINPFAIGLTQNGNSAPMISSLQFGIGSGESFNMAYLDSSSLTLGTTTFASGFDAPGTSTEAEAFACSQVAGDPHFIGFRNQKYDFHGEKGKYFNLVSDVHFQLNSLFIDANLREGKQKTYMGELGFLIGNDRLFIGCDRNSFDVSIKLNGKPLARGKTWLDYGQIQRRANDHVIINAAPYRFRVRFSESMHSTCHINFKSKYAFSAGGHKPHGVLGQTADPDRVFEPVKGDLQGAGVVEGHWEEYMLKDNDIFGTDFVYNRYSPDDHTEHHQKHYGGQWMNAQGE